MEAQDHAEKSGTHRRSRRWFVAALTILLMLLLLLISNLDRRPRSGEVPSPSRPAPPMVSPVPLPEEPAAPPESEATPAPPADPDESIEPAPRSTSAEAELPPPVDGVISGVVRGDSGPLAGARVEANDSAGRVFTGPWGQKTGEDGRFSVDVGDAAWPVHLRIGRDGYLVAHLDVPEATNSVDAKLERGLSIEGRLVDENGNGVDAAVSGNLIGKDGRLVPWHGLGPAILSLCDETGRFALRGLEPGRYRIHYAGANYARVPASEVDCAAGDRKVVLVVRRACALRLLLEDGTTGGSPARRVTIHITDRHANTRMITADIPRVNVPGLEPGDYSIRVSAPGYATVDVPRLTLNQLGRVHEVKVELERKGDWGEGALVIHVPCPVREAADGSHPLLWVMIRDENGEPIEGDPGPHKRTGDEFRVTRKVPAGRYRIHAWTKDDRWASRTVEVNSDWDQTVSLELTLLRAGWVRLTVKQPEHPRRKVVLEDPQGIRQGVSLWDVVPAKTGRLGPMPPGQVTLRLLDGGVEIAKTTVDVVADREVPVRFR